MLYKGSKRVIAKHIIPIITEHLTDDKWYVEPFVGGANMIDKIQHDKRIGADINEYLIELFKAIQKGWQPPNYVSREEFYRIKDNKDEDKVLAGWVGFTCSYGGKWFDSYANDYKDPKKRKEGVLHTRQNGCINSMQRQRECLHNINFIWSEYDKLDIPKKSIIYCDPPYRNVGQYGFKFDHLKFDSWVLRQVEEGHSVYISEYEMSDDFVCIKEIPKKSQLSKGCGIIKQTVEKLFVHKAQL